MTQYSKTLTIQGSFIPVDLNQHKELNEVEVNETDMGQADARKSAPSSKEEQEKVFSRTEKNQEIFVQNLMLIQNFLLRKLVSQ